MNAILLTAILCGPVPDSKPNLTLYIHVGAGRESAIARSELRRKELWFQSKLMYVERHYKIEVKETLYKSRPCYQIGKGDDWHEFPPGTFASSGSFVRTLESIADQDQFARHEPEWLYQPWDWEIPYVRPKGPVVFPPVLEGKE